MLLFLPSKEVKFKPFDPKNHRDGLYEKQNNTGNFCNRIWGHIFYGTKFVGP